MNKLLRKLAGVFGASPIPQMRLSAQLMMDKHLLGLLIRAAYGYDVRTKYRNAKPIGLGFRKSYAENLIILRNNPFCYVVKVGFKRSVVRVHGLELLVPNECIKQQEA